jgi:hypothetical protein
LCVYIERERERILVCYHADTLSHTHTRSPNELLQDVKEKLTVSERELTEVKLERDTLKIPVKELQTAVNAVQNALKGLSCRNRPRREAQAKKAAGIHSTSSSYT